MRCLKGFGFMGILALLSVTPAFATEKSNATQLIELAKSNSPGLRDAITASLDAKDLMEGRSHGSGRWSGLSGEGFARITA